MKSILKTIIILLLIFVLIYSSFTMYLINTTSNELLPNQKEINIYNACKVIVILSSIILYGIWLISELKNATKDDNF